MKKTDLLTDKDTFTSLDLLKKAATYKGLELQENALKAYSEPIKVYALDDKLLTALAERGIKRQARPDCHDEIFTLVDENPQEKIQGWEPSNYWNFKLLEGKFDLRIALSVSFEIKIKKRGIMLWPQAHGSFVSATDQLPKFRIFKALVENDEDAPDIAKELAPSDGSIMVTWTDLGLGGIRRVSDLFAEFTGSETIKQLGKAGKVFDPAPYPQYQKSDDELFITEPAQPKVFEAWQKQLNEYRTSLVNLAA